MHTVYILYSEKDKKLYTGCTVNIENRLTEHNSGNVFATKHRRPLVVIHQEQYSSETEAFEHEKFLKSLWGARTKKEILKRFLSQQK